MKSGAVSETGSLAVIGAGEGREGALPSPSLPPRIAPTCYFHERYGVPGDRPLLWKLKSEPDAKEWYRCMDCHPPVFGPEHLDVYTPPTRAAEETDNAESH